MANRFHAFFGAAVVALGAIPSNASAFCIGYDKTLPTYDPRYYSVAHEFRRSEWVVKAKVLRETWIGEDGKEKPLQPPFQNGSRRPWGFDPYAGAFYTLQVERVFKGDPPATFRVFSENADDRFWLFKGDEVLAFVSSETFEAPIGKQHTLDVCGNSGRLPEVNGALTQVLNDVKKLK